MGDRLGLLPLTHSVATCAESDLPRMDARVLFLCHRAARVPPSGTNVPATTGPGPRYREPAAWNKISHIVMTPVPLNRRKERFHGQSQ